MDNNNNNPTPSDPNNPNLNNPIPTVPTTDTPAAWPPPYTPPAAAPDPQPIVPSQPQVIPTTPVPPVPQETPAWTPPVNETPPAAASYPWDQQAQPSTTPTPDPITTPQPTAVPDYSSPQPAAAPVWDPSVPAQPTMSDSLSSQPPTPAIPDPIPQSASDQPDTSSWNPQPAPPIADPMAQPAPTFTPPADQSMNGSLPVPPQTSPLDNPWGAPIQVPPIDGGNPTPSDSMPTWMPSTPTDTGVNPQPASSIQTEPAPTDLSHLITNNSQPEQAPETLVVPGATSAPEIPTVSTENHKRIPKWLIGIGVGLLIIVAGASAYFILGVGKPPETTTSLPATQAPAQTIKQPLPIATPESQPTATGSANFGALEGGSGQTATSAADILKQRQGR